MSKSKTGCRAHPKHKCSWYKEYCRPRLEALTNIIHNAHERYTGYSTHIFHRELAEEIDDFVQGNLKEWKKPFSK